MQIPSLVILPTLQCSLKTTVVLSVDIFLQNALTLLSKTVKGKCEVD